MFSVDNLKAFVEERLNEALWEFIKAREMAKTPSPTVDEAEAVADAEVSRNPFKIFTDLGEAEKSYRSLNDVYSKRYGVLSTLSSNVTPLGGIQIYNGTFSVDILVNIDRPIGTPDDTGEYIEVKETRSILDTVAANDSATAHPFTVSGVDYSVVPVFTLSTAGTFEVQASKLGKIVPLSFTVDVSVVEQGINSAEIMIYITHHDSPGSGYGTPIQASQIAEDMVISSEGQTRIGAHRSTFNEQEARYSLSFVTPFISEWLQTDFVTAMHTGVSEIYKVSVKYPIFPLPFVHYMKLSSVRLTAQIPNNAGLNVELVEVDEPPS